MGTENAPQGPAMDMRPPQSAGPTPPPVPPSHTDPPLAAVPPMAPFSRRKFRRGGFPLGTALIAVAVVAACGVVLYAFAGAKVTITPRTNSAAIAADFSATSGQGDIPFEVVTVNKTVNANVPAESTITANDPAFGKITITNQQTTPQALIKNTRFETPAKLIFRIRDSVSIPAGGSITVTVYADEAGEKYNVAPTTFRIPGLAGSKAYELVTAKSDAAMTGGFSGTRPAVAQATKDKQYADMQAKLAPDLAKDLAAKIPAGYILVPGASFMSYEPLNDTAGASGTVSLSEQGTITAVVMPADALARAIAFKAVGSYAGEPVTLKDVAGLTAKPAEASIAPDAQTFNFNLTGTANIVWQVDAAKIAGAVAGKTRDSAKIALESLTEVNKASLVLRPFWAQHFPGDPAKIKVIVAGAPTGK
jgi:hypothetical protein